jgi:hypothetical protein
MSKQNEIWEKKSKIYQKQRSTTSKSQSMLKKYMEEFLGSRKLDQVNFGVGLKFRIKIFWIFFCFKDRFNFK